MKRALLTSVIAALLTAPAALAEQAADTDAAQTADPAQSQQEAGALPEGENAAPQVDGNPMQDRLPLRNTEEERGGSQPLPETYDAAPQVEQNPATDGGNVAK